VPIPAFYRPDGSSPLLNRATIEHFARLVRDNGTADVWWTMGMEELLPKEVTVYYLLSLSSHR
jgi:isoleucyl-tRNA synthetase